jgi:hypothetical protein
MSTKRLNSSKSSKKSFSRMTTKSFKKKTTKKLKVAKFAKEIEEEVSLEDADFDDENITLIDFLNIAKDYFSDKDSMLSH